MWYYTKTNVQWWFEVLADIFPQSDALSSYYMAVSYKDWELPNSRIWLAEIDIDRGLDFPI